MKKLCEMRFFITQQSKIYFLFKGYVFKALLGLVGICYCPRYENLCLEPDEIEIDDENSVCCEDLTAEPEEVH